MCGIAGMRAVESAGRSLPGCDALRAMTNALAHRGPDSSDVWHDARRGVAFGHTRLAIRDLSPAGAQPMTSSCGRYVLTYNGEVYSQDELARDLAPTGRRMRGTSDTELMVEAFAAWGVAKVMPKLIGMFAFALFDKQTGELVLARDRMGIKPLYWALKDGLFLFGSELKALRALDTWQPRLDRDALAAFMRFGYVPAPHTIYQGVQKLEPGCLLRLNGDGYIAIERYWDFLDVAQDEVEPNADALSEREKLDHLEALLLDAVGRRLIADVPLGTLLSGGIDSSLVAALMVERSAQQVRTFSIGFAEKGFDEAPYARDVAAHLGTDHTELYVAPGDALETISQLPEWYDEPFADSSQIPTALVCALTRKHVTVVLSGDGGDELFAGYNRYTIGLDMWKRAGVLPRQVRHAVAGGILSQPAGRLDQAAALLPARLRPGQFGGKLHKLAEAMRIDDPGEMYRRLVSQWPETERLVLGGNEAAPAAWSRCRLGGDGDLLAHMQRLDTLTYLPDDILTKVDRASMAVALEVRVPLIDHRVVAAAWALPRNFKLRNGQGKWALRQLLYRRVPQRLIERPKMGFGIPLDDWLRGPLRAWSEELLDETRLKDQGVFNVAALRQAWSGHLAGGNAGARLWCALMALAWLEKNPDIAL